MASDDLLIPALPLGASAELGRADCPGPSVQLSRSTPVSQLCHAAPLFLMAAFFGLLFHLLKYVHPLVAFRV